MAAMADDVPSEMRTVLADYDEAFNNADKALKPLLETPHSEIQEVVCDPLDKAKIDLVAAYAMNAMFWIYLTMQGVNPREHPIKQELDRIRNYMNRIKDITDKKKAARLDKGAAARFIKHSLAAPDKDQSKPKEAKPSGVNKRKHEDRSKSKKKKKIQ
ncbi:nuclear nucleic acid-binding protein C1D-like [Saccoglossus kowalevskii]|uniref:Nuclear nucleic acid-binding protein C1D n=1 Tax=Saccoglossus kowalevskii TaxID=10224 RepID=A0ABM0GTU8_SACKO|nr:PREDICTED: nuclear nucleic acid-binding protein C1D-like [Saccoglossus kowalevskii]